MPINVDLGGIANAITAAAESLGKFADSVSKVASLSIAGYDEVTARKDQARLKQLYMKLVDYETVQGNAEHALETYIKYCESGATEAHLGPIWSEFRSKIDTLAAELTPIVEAWKTEQADFILEEAYVTLRKTLSVRSELFFDFLKMDEPKTAEEVAQVRLLHQAWTHLMSELKRSRVALSSYLSK